MKTSNMISFFSEIMYGKLILSGRDEVTVNILNITFKF